MIAQKLTCLHCRAAVPVQRRPAAGQQVLCPNCGHHIAFDKPCASQSGDTCPPVVAEPRRVVVPREALLAVAASVLITGGAIVAALVLTREHAPAPAAGTGTEPASGHVAEQLRKIDAERKALEQEKSSVEVALLLAQASLAHAQGHYADAEKRYQEILTRAPENSDALMGLVQARVALASEAKAHEDKAGREAHYARLMVQGREALTRKEYAGAARFFTSALQARPDDAAAMAALAQVQQAQATEEVAKRQQAEYQAHVDAGKAAVAAKRYEDAIQAFRAAQRLNPNDEIAAALKDAETRLNDQQDREKRQAQFAGLMERGDFAMRQRRYDAAAEAIGEALKLFPEDREAKEKLRKAKQAKKDARSEFNKLMAQGNAALQNQQLEEAARAYAGAAALFPDDATAGRMVKQLDQLLQGVPTNQAAYVRLITQAALALRAGLFANAAGAYLQALRIAPNDPEALLGLREAQANLNGALIAGGDFNRFVTAGAQSLRQGQWGDAVKAYRAALRLAPNDPAAAAGLQQARFQQAMARGRAAMAARRFTDAGHFFREALEQAPGDVQALAGLRQAQALLR